MNPLEEIRGATGLSGLLFARSTRTTLDSSCQESDYYLPFSSFSPSVVATLTRSIRFPASAACYALQSFPLSSLLQPECRHDGKCVIIFPHATHATQKPVKERKGEDETKLRMNDRLTVSLLAIGRRCCGVKAERKTRLTYHLPET